MESSVSVLKTQVISVFNNSIINSSHWVHNGSLMECHKPKVVHVIYNSIYNELYTAHGPTWRLEGEFGALLQGLVDVDTVWGKGSSPCCQAASHQFPTPNQLRTVDLPERREDGQNVLEAAQQPKESGCTLQPAWYLCLLEQVKGETQPVRTAGLQLQAEKSQSQHGSFELHTKK